jgi:nanoRNase/pAp phosphatase (c-di-AMP/oligoRNAs hydrolase)
MSDTTQSTGELIYQETQRVAAEIERSVAGVVADTSRFRVKVSYETHLPPEVAEIARDHGYELYAVFGQTADFKRAD